MQNFKIGQAVLGISRLFDFQDGRRLPSWIFKYFNIWSTVRLRGLIYIAEPNYTKMVTVVEISHLTFFIMATIRHLQLFLPRDALLSAVYAVVVCLSVGLSVCLSVCVCVCVCLCVSVTLR